MLRFSANLGLMWPGLDLPHQIDAAARAGFKAIELHYPYAYPAVDLARKCAALDVKLLSINTNIRSGPAGHFGLAAVPGHERAFRDLFNQSLDYALVAQATAIHVMAGRVAPGNRDKAHACLIDNLKWATSEASRQGMTLLLEPLNSKDAPGYFYSKLEQVAAVIDAIGQPGLGLMLDAYHVGREGEDPVELLKTFFAVIRHVQIAAVPSRTEPDEGELDYAKFLSELDNSGYQGWIGCEYKPRGDTDAGLVWAERMGLSITAGSVAL